MYLPVDIVSDMKEERDKEARAAAQEQEQDDARLLLAAAREKIASLEAENAALRLAAQQEG